MSSYQKKFTWRNRYGDWCLAHHDGAVSLLIGWDGFDVSMLSPAEVQGKWDKLRQFVKSIGDEFTLESHFFRTRNIDVAYSYIAQNERIVRGKKLGIKLRTDMANHLSMMAKSNQVYFVLTRKPVSSVLMGIKRKLINQGRNAEKLLLLAQEAIQFLPGGRVLSNQAYSDLIYYSINPSRRLMNAPFKEEGRFFLNEQLVQEKPQWVDDALRFNDGGYQKTFLLANYPDADLAWFDSLANNFHCDVHVSQVIQPINTRSAMRKSESDSRKTEGTTGGSGTEYAAGKANDLSEFRQFVAEHDLEIFGNTYVITLYQTDRDILRLASQELTQFLTPQGVRVKEGKNIELLFYRISQPGMGRYTTFSRPDHELLVTNMMPVNTYRKGVENPTILRMDANAQLVGFDYREGGVNHAFTAAKTGSGKGVNKVAEIGETFPLGVDWYIAEVGTSYQWVVEGFGGNYLAIDPDKTVVNPFPPFGYADTESEYPLKSAMVTPTVKAISSLLTNSLKELDSHQQAVAENAMQLMYLEEVESLDEAPGFVQFLEMLRVVQSEVDMPAQKKAAAEMADNLESFLSTTAGATFKRKDNFVLSEGITGVDLKPLATSGNDKLMLFYLVFIALRFSQFAFMKATPSRILLDELHEFTRTEEGKIVIGRLAKQITRMGRKDAGAFDAISQEPDDIDVDDGVMGQMQHRNLLYLQEGHEKTATRLRIPDKAVQVWKEFKDPEGLTYRQGVRTMGEEAYNLHLSFSPLMLDLADSSPWALQKKIEIGMQTNDPFERLQLFQQAKEARNA